MASHSHLGNPDYIGLSKSSSSPDSQENNCRPMHNSNTFEKKRKSSMRKNLFPGKYPALFYQTKRCFTVGVGKINKAFNNLKCSIQSATQSLRFNGYKRYEFEDGKISTFLTPNRNIRSVLGRTPIKLYSPFGIETPASSKY